MMASRISCCITFPGMEVRLTGLQFPGSSFLPFLKTGVTLAFLQSSDTSPVLQDLSKMMESGSSNDIRQLPQHSWVPSMGAHVMSRQGCALAWRPTVRVLPALLLFSSFTCQNDMLTAKVTVGSGHQPTLVYKSQPGTIWEA